MKKAYLNWSTCKDSNLALYRVQQADSYTVEALFSVVMADNAQIAMHEIGTVLLKKQAAAIGIPLTIFNFDPKWSKKEYGVAINQPLEKFKAAGIATALFGDLYLQDLRKKREENCLKAGIKADFPLWNIPSKKIVREFVDLGFKAIVTCIDNAVLPEEFLGRLIDDDFINDLPDQVDCCGENGEYHSFVFDGPTFSKPVDFTVTSKYFRDYPDSNSAHPHRYWYLNLK
jgi:uncharacterized protein (TIGR00290 family)